MKSCALLITGLAISVAGCTPGIKQMHERFQADVQYAVGFTLDQLQNGKFRFIGKRKPTSQKKLANGNILYVYGEYWVQYDIDRTPCDVFLEVHPESDMVVAARSEGDGCYMPY